MGTAEIFVYNAWLIPKRWQRLVFTTNSWRSCVEKTKGHLSTLWGCHPRPPHLWDVGWNPEQVGPRYILQDLSRSRHDVTFHISRHLTWGSKYTNILTDLSKQGCNPCITVTIKAIKNLYIKTCFHPPNRDVFLRFLALEHSFLIQRRRWHRQEKEILYYLS